MFPRETVLIWLIYAKCLTYLMTYINIRNDENNVETFQLTKYI